MSSRGRLLDGPSVKIMCYLGDDHQQFGGAYKGPKDVPCDLNFSNIERVLPDYACLFPENFATYRQHMGLSNARKEHVSFLRPLYNNRRMGHNKWTVSHSLTI